MPTTLPLDWWRRATPALESGTISLVLPVDAAVVDGDILLMDLMHKGASFATVPGGWTLVGQVLQGATRVEMYWRRASSEPASYTVTGMATVALGAITPYYGGLASGSVISAVSTGGAAGGSDLAANSVAIPDDVALLHCIVGSGAAESPIPFLGNTSSGTFTEVNDPTVRSLLSVVRGDDGANGGLAISDNVKVNAGASGDLRTALNAGEHAGIIGCFKAEPARTDTKTRYYLTLRYSKDRLYGPPLGDWDSSWESPRGFDPFNFTFELSQAKACGGQMYGWKNTPGKQEYVTINRRDVGVMWKRWVSPPLAAQSISGTLDACVSFLLGLPSAPFGDNPNPTVQLMVHAAVVDGTTLALKTTLLDNYINGYSNNDLSGSHICHRFDSPQSITSASIASGDRIVVEIGAYITTDIAYPTPITRPPTRWVSCQSVRGTCITVSQTANPQTSTVGVVTDQTASGDVISFTDERVPWVEFSQVLDHLAPSGSTPSNTTSAAATVISSFPYDSGDIDTTRCAGPMRAMWYTFTPSFTGKLFFNTFGANYNQQTTAYQVAPGTTWSAVRANDQQNIYSSTMWEMNVVSGVTYWLRFQTKNDPWNAPATGGCFRLYVNQYQAPANNDLIYPNAVGYVMRYTEAGVLVDCNQTLRGEALTGVALDLTGRVYPADYSPTIPGGKRLNVGVFNGSFTSNGWIEILDFDDPFMQEQDINFQVSIDGTLGNAGRDVSALSIRQDGLIVVGYFGNGFCRVATIEHSYLSEVATLNAADLNIGDSIYHDVNYDPTAPMDVIPTTLDVGGSNYVEWDPSGENVYYTSGGWYVPVGGQNIYKYNVGSGLTTLFATVPVGPGPNPGVKGLFPLPQTPTTPSGGLLVCNGGEVLRLNTSGAVVATYTPTGRDLHSSLADVELQADGRYFWVLDEMASALHKFDMQSGLEVLTVPTFICPGSSTSILIYRAEAFPPGGGGLRLTQLPVEVAYDYALLQPFVKGNGLDWVTPPKTLTS